MEYKKVTAASDPRIEFWMRRDGSGAWTQAVSGTDASRDATRADFDCRCLPCEFGHAHTLACHAFQIQRYEEAEPPEPRDLGPGHDCRCLCGTLFPCEEPECLCVAEHEATCPECRARERRGRRTC